MRNAKGRPLRNSSAWRGGRGGGGGAVPWYIDKHHRTGHTAWGVVVGEEYCDITVDYGPTFVSNRSPAGT